jgi:hypothetical protein
MVTTGGGGVEDGGGPPPPHPAKRRTKGRTRKNWPVRNLEKTIGMYYSPDEWFTY